MQGGTDGLLLLLLLLQHVELRVKAMVACKDEAIQQLQQQLAAALEALRGTEAVLAAQQEELRQV
jgi:uncharacterized membrane protein YecN with MAPEG domain